MMYVTKPAVCWIFILSCWRVTEETMQMKKGDTSISTTNRTGVALTGETLYISLYVKIPANSTNQIKCQHDVLGSVWEKRIESKNVQSNKQVVVIKMHNTSFSGDYSCSYMSQAVHWVILVRDKGYEEPDDVLEIDVIIQMIFSGAVLIFNVVGSLYILKRYKEQPSSKDKKNKALEERPTNSEDAAMDEDDASASLYTDLQPRPGSIYDMLSPEVMTHAEDTKNCKLKNSKAQEEEVFDSVYENL
nr:NFAT activation molecule 1 [Misgurnus anguillicaudatus]